jgi:hypothetical protein
MLIHRGERYQRGRGIGALFSGFFRVLRPVLKMGLTAGKKFIQSDVGRQIKSSALEMGKDAVKNIASDILKGENLKESLNRELQSAKTKIADKIRGSGRKRKKTKSHSISTPIKKLKFNLLD